MFLNRIMHLINWISICVVTFLSCNPSHANECPSPCTCSVGHISVTCVGVALTKMPELPWKSEVVNLDSNDISILYNHTLDASPFIQIISLEDNGIIHIEAGTFASLPNLEILRLGKNHISHLPNDIFQFNRKLEILDLHSNSFTEIPDYIMLPLHHLQILNMSYNSLTTPMLGQGFKVTTKLATIDLSGNNLVALESHVFQATLWWDDKVTHYLNLSYCNIQHIFPNSVNQLYHIDSISLNGNDAIPGDQLQSALDDLSISSVEELILSHMNISDIHQFFSQSQHRNLQQLTLSHNHITEVRDRTFYYLVKLKLLDLSHNYLSSLNNLDGLTSLEHLYLSHNQLTDISETLFEELTLLKVLDLSHNFLTNIDDAPFQMLFDLQHLDLGANQLTSFDITTGFENLEILSVYSNKLRSMSKVGILMKLKTLDMSGNEITSVGPNTFSQGQSLDVVNISHNSITDIDENAFADSIVNVLDLSHNKLTSLHYYGLQQVKRFHAQANAVQNISVDALYRQNTLFELNIEQNQIRWLPRYLFTPIYSLKTICLSNNPLGNYFASTEDSHTIFNDLIKLEILNLANVSIKYITSDVFRNLKSLRYLDISRNSISITPPDIFADSSNLLFMNISYNSIQIPQTKLFQNLKRLQQLDISFNPFRCTCEILPFKQWLSNTNITVLGPMICEEPQKWKDTSVQDLHLDSSDCSSRTKLIIFISAGCALILLLICILIGVLYGCRKKKRRKLDKLDYSAISYADKEAHIRYNPQNDMELRCKKAWT